MPIYEYECTKCGRTTEVWQKITDDPLTTCDHCKGKLRKLISMSTFHLKGSGWYVTDYGGKKQESCKHKKESEKKDTKEPKCEKGSSAKKDS